VVVWVVIRPMWRATARLLLAAAANSYIARPRLVLWHVKLHFNYNTVHRPVLGKICEMAFKIIHDTFGGTFL